MRLEEASTPQLVAQLVICDYLTSILVGCSLSPVQVSSIHSGMEFSSVKGSWPQTLIRHVTMEIVNRRSLHLLTHFCKLIQVCA